MYKLKFDIEKAEIIEENPDSQFATASLLLFSSGKNRHDMNCTEDVLKETASTAYEKPIIFEINNMFGDFGSHNEKTTVPAGFIVPDSGRFVRQDDGRLSFFVNGKIWKKYSGKFLDIFRQNHKTKSKLSVEIELHDKENRSDGLIEMKSFSYAAACILGDIVTEASPGANIQMLSFSEEDWEEYESDLRILFEKYDGINFSIPKEVKNNAKNGLDNYEKTGKGGNSVALAEARFVLKNEKSEPRRVRNMFKYFSSHANDNLTEDSSNPQWITWQLWGGDTGYKWSGNLVNKMNSYDEKRVSYFSEMVTFPYTKRSDMNPALKGIDPPITPSQGSEIAKVADAIGSDKKKNGWAIAIAQFKKTHKVVNGHWVKKQKSEENQSMEDFTKDKLGTGKALRVNKSKDALSTKSWGDVDKTALRNRILEASNYKTLVHSVYMVVEDGWEDAPSEHLKYPVMCLEGDTLVYCKGGLSSALGYAKANGENAVVSKVQKIQKKLGVSKEGEDVKNSVDNPETDVDNCLPPEGDQVNNDASDDEKNEEIDNSTDDDKDGDEVDNSADDDKDGDTDDGNGKDDDEDVDNSADDPDNDKDTDTGDGKDDTDKDFSLNAYLDISAVLSFLEKETKMYHEVADNPEDIIDETTFGLKSKEKFDFQAELMKSPEEMNYGKLAVAAYAEFCKMTKFCKQMSAKMAKLESENKAYMDENEKLKAFKMDVEQKQFNFEVDFTVKELQKTEMPQTEIDSIKEESKKYTLENIETWKNFAKAKAFNFALKINEKDDVKSFGLPWEKPKDKKLWDRIG